MYDTFCRETLKYDTFCRKTLKYDTFCRKTLKYGTFVEKYVLRVMSQKMANLRCEPSPHFMLLWLYQDIPPYILLQKDFYMISRIQPRANQLCIQSIFFIVQLYGHTYYFIL